MSKIKNFAIKEGMNFKLTDNATKAEYFTVDYINSASLSLEGDTTYAKKRGTNAIAFPNAKTGTFTIEADVSNEKMLALQLDGVLSQTTAADDTITVKAIGKSKSFKLEGTFNVTFDDGTGTGLRKIVMGNVSPQTNAEITFSDEEITVFKMVFDVLVDSKGDLVVIGPEGLGAE
ncbi:Uncharacterised protein [[Clostridium] sordellii]|uniref:hypothetical protein n=1 Tax=Paraclostridium sordellii TaxID=1505 RepID=UPI0005E61CC3|nr:hypothetical protein [Paeniclostridium sordellii]CEQ01733.1 Uncharacterised protein [[Clostridium] sordellii] [Paeniclostridium sordellii]